MSTLTWVLLTSAQLSSGGTSAGAVSVASVLMGVPSSPGHCDAWEGACRHTHIMQ